MPILGLIFLRHAANRYEAVEQGIEATLPTRGSQIRPITREDFKGRAVNYLPAEARYEVLVGLPQGADMSQKINAATASDNVTGLPIILRPYYKVGERTTTSRNIIFYDTKREMILFLTP